MMVMYRNFLSRRRSLVFVLTLGGLCIYAYYIKQHFKNTRLEEQDFETYDFEENEVYTENKADNIYAKYTNHRLFQPSEAVDFPVSNRTARIPHIVHQISDSEHVLEMLAGLMRSFVDNNPTWEYRFWTYESGRKLLELYYPYLLNIYDKFGKNNVRKSDLLRYAVLHKFGGIYADLDVKNLRPLDRATIKYACIVPTEPFEHSAIVYGQEAILSTAVMLCRPGHPFLEQILINLHFADPDGHPITTTGPWYLTQMYLIHNGMYADDLRKTKIDNSTNSPYFYKGTRPEEDDDSVYVPNSQYFMDSVDHVFLKEGELEACTKPVENKDREHLIYRACHEFESRKDLRKNKKYTFTIHYWFHMWTMHQEHIDREDKVYIKDVIPTCILYTS